MTHSDPLSLAVGDGISARYPWSLLIVPEGYDKLAALRWCAGSVGRWFF